MADDLERSVAPRLGLSQSEVAKLGGFGVLRESVKVFGGLHPSLVWIQFCLVLPYSLYLVVDQYAQQAILNKLVPNLPGGDVPWPSWDEIETGIAHLDLSKWLGILLLVGLVVLSFAISLVILATVFYAVGAIYYGRSATFSEVVHSVPRLWSRLFVTAVVDGLLVLSVGVAYAGFVVIFKLGVPANKLVLVVSIFAAIFFIPLFILNLIYQVANGVTCFEDHCGTTAFRKGKHLLHGKWWSALVLFILLLIPSILVTLLIDFPDRLTTEFHWRWLVLTIVYVFFTSYLTELICVSWAVFYFSCAANYELYVAPTQQEDNLESGYQEIPVTFLDDVFCCHPQII
ncbi:hypothetical protein R1sor_014639 [Riccia sorocarpa]|uniref:Uncharacterized protein n=1 Tax=Riccia sorocarpa TaxID=122646 RepID=A0ABD3HD54_9MARC